MKIALLFSLCFVAAIAAPAEDTLKDLMALREDGMKLRNDMFAMLKAEHDLDKAEEAMIKELLADLDKILPKIKELDTLITAEMKNVNPTDVIHKSRLEYEHDRLTLLSKQLMDLETKLKNHKPHIPNETEHNEHTAEELRKEIRRDLNQIEEDFKRLQNDIRHHDKTQAEEDRKKIIDDIEKVKPFIREAEKKITDELKKTTDRRHRFVLERELIQLRSAERQLSRMEERVKRAQHDGTYADEHPMRHLWEQISRMAMEGEKLFMALLQKEAEFGKIIQADRQKIIADIDRIVPKMKELEKKVAAELAKKPTDELHLFFLEAERDGLAVFEKDLLALEARLKNHK